MEGEKHGYYGQTMNRSLPILGGLILLVSGCGRRSSEPSAEQPSLVRELQVKSDYGQIYIYDPHTDSWRDTDTQDNNPLLRALDDASHSRRFVGYDDGFVDVLTPSQYNWSAPMRIEVSDRPPPLDADGWDHIVEVPLPVPSGTLSFEASGGGEPIETQIPPGTYRARVSGRGYSARAGEIEGHESYRLQLWPAKESAPVLIKYWDGFDRVQPDG